MLNSSKVVVVVVMDSSSIVIISSSGTRGKEVTLPLLACTSWIQLLQQLVANWPSSLH